jgi:hypothetical protein
LRPSTIDFKSQDSWGFAGPETKNDCADDDRQQITRPDQTRADPTRQDKTRPEETRPEFSSFGVHVLESSIILGLVLGSFKEDVSAGDVTYLVYDEKDLMPVQFA